MNNNSYKERINSTNKNEIRLGINIILKKKYTKSNELFNAEMKVYSHQFLAYNSNIEGFSDDDRYRRSAFNVYVFPTVQEIITQKYTAFNFGYIKPSFPAIYHREPNLDSIIGPNYPWVKPEKYIASFLFHWDKYSIHGLTFGIMQRTFKRYKVEISSPIKRKFGLAKESNGYRSSSIEYGANIFLGTPSRIKNQLLYDLSGIGGEVYYKYHYMPFVFKINGGKMIGRPHDWYLRVSFGLAFQAGKAIFN